MKLFHFLLTASLVLLNTLAQSQDAKAKTILDELSSKTRKYNSITSDFTFTLEDKMAGVNQTQSGTLKMQDKKYYIRLGDNQIFSDGATRWTFNQEMNEVYIDEATAGDEALNPADIYTVWETGFKQYYEQEITEGGKQYHLIKLVPLKPEKKTYHSVKLYIDKTKMQIARILILGKQGDNYTYKVESFKTEAEYPAETFVFPASKFPGAEVVDNR